MSLKLSGYLFTGPFPIATVIRANQHPVVFAIIDKSGPGWAPTFRVVDVGFSEDSGVDFVAHPARSSWNTSGDGELSLYLLRCAAIEIHALGAPAHRGRDPAEIRSAERRGGGITSRARQRSARPKRVT